MNHATAVDSEEPVFDALLTPHRSMGRTGFYVVMGIFGTIWFATGLLFWSLGAWPVLGFFGLDLFLLWFAFRLNYRAARAREEVRVWRHAMLIRKIEPSGKVAEHRFNPFWVKFHVSRHEEIGVTGMAISERGLSVPVGAFLNPDDRESFSQAFAGALATVKRG